MDEDRTVYAADRVLAEHQVQLAVASIAARHRLLGTVLVGMRVRVTTVVTTVVTSLRAGRLALTVHPTWAGNAPMPEVEGALIHEVNHLLLGHHEIDGTGLDAELLDIAKDLAANEYNDRPAPAGTATLTDFPAFPLGESVLTRYARLRALLDQTADEPRQAGDDGDETDGGHGDDGDDGEAGPADGAGEDAGDGDGDGDSEAGDGDADATPTQADKLSPGVGQASSPADGDIGDPGDASKEPASATTDGPSDKESPGTPSDQVQDTDPAANRLTVRSIISAAARKVPDTDLSKLERGMLVQIQASSTACGDGTAGAFSLLSPSGRTGALVPWKSKLRRYVGEALPVSHPSYARPSRRFPDLLGIVPGKESRPGKPVIQAVIDTSGSMTDGMLSEIAAELRVLARGRRVIVVQCDCKVHSVERFSGRINRCIGRGGTDFNPVFEPDLLRRTKADLIIVFSDGCGPAPEEPPRVPVIWALTAPFQPPATWGEVIQLPYDDEPTAH